MLRYDKIRYISDMQVIVDKIHKYTMFGKAYYHLGSIAWAAVLLPHQILETIWWHIKYRFLGRNISFTFACICLVIYFYITNHKRDQNQQQTKRSKIVYNYLSIERVEWKQILSMSEFKKSQAGDRIDRLRVGVCTVQWSKYISVTSAMKQILVLRVQWSKYISVTSAIKQIY